MRANEFTNMLYRLAELERRMNNVTRPAKVTATDPAKGLVKVAWTEVDGQPVESPWIPWKTRAGAIKEWAPPSVGEQVTIMSPSGEIGQHSWVDTGGFSNDNQQNHDKDGEYKISIGGTTIFANGDEVRFKSAKIVLEGDTHLGGEGGVEVHRKGDIDTAGDAAVTHASKVWAL